MSRNSANGNAAAAFGRAATGAAGFLQSGASEPLAEGAMTYAEINALMAGR
jgi:hypothetical protein